MNPVPSAIEGSNRAGNPGDIIPDSCITGFVFLSQPPVFSEPCYTLSSGFVQYVVIV
ncbi:MAG: hypothetical protein K2P57_08970 [Burkholderiales bacterium]|nr:hypothetical protein [Burkholderiales bacterium]